VPSFEGSGANLSQASLNIDMIGFLDLKPGETVCDFGSGCGLTANTFAKFGCKVKGFEVSAEAVKIARRKADEIGIKANVEFVHGSVNKNIAEQVFDKLHGGYMMNETNANKYLSVNLKDGGIAVLNVEDVSSGYV
jgi:protein-L-isoaspartate O-methyltransferase